MIINKFITFKNKLTNFMEIPFYKKLQYLNLFLSKLKTKYYYSIFLNRCGENSSIIKPLELSGLSNISIGKNVIIDKFAWLICNNKADMEKKLTFGDGTKIGHFNHIVCYNGIHISENVLTADNVYISDNYHGFENIDIPIKFQDIKSKGEVFIGEGSWIGENTTILSCRIGKHCVIGANSVVNKNIPDYSVAVGAPARVIKQYDFEKEEWVKVNHEE